MFKVQSMRADNSHIINHEYKSFTFPGGEIHPTLEVSNKIEYDKSKVVIEARLNSGNDIIELLMLNNIIDKNFKGFEKELKLYYTMFSRQDRAANIGEAESLKVFCNLINSMNFDKVITFDNHSDVANALLNNNEEVTQLDLVKRAIPIPSEYDYVISPDAGANKKTLKVAQYLEIPVIQADKTRDTLTGEITGTVVYADWQTIGQTKVLIVDDICDGGRTVIEIAKILKEKGVDTINCFFTHGIFSKGYDVLFNSGIDKIFTTNSFNTPEDDRIIKINI